MPSRIRQTFQPRTKEWLGDKKEAVMSKVGGAPAKVGEFTPDGGEVKHRMGSMKRTAERNPLGLAIGGAAVGFIVGLASPSTRIEDERIGPMADELKSTATEAGREAVERGKTVAREAGTTAIGTAKEAGHEQGEELAASLQDKARDTVPQRPPRVQRSIDTKHEGGRAPCSAPFVCGR